MFRLEKRQDILERDEEFKKLDPEFQFLEEGVYFTCSSENELIGYSVLVPDEVNSSLELKKIFIKKEERYKCTGSKLIKFIEKNLGKCHCQKISYSALECREFFKKIGFENENGILIYNKIQNRKKRQRDNNRIIIFSILGNIVLAFTKITFGISGKSRALLSDGINSLSDVATSTGMLIGVHFSNMPEDEEHPYGHERIESIIANILGIFMILTAFELLRGSADMLISYYRAPGSHTIPKIDTIFWGIFSAVVKVFMAYYKLKIGKRTGNMALIADGKDSRNDIFTSLGAVLGILLAIYVHPYFDILLSIPIALVIMKEGVVVLFENANIILDKQDSELLREIESYVYRNSNIKNIHDLRMRYSGDRVFINMDIRVPGKMSVSEAHRLTEMLEKSILVEFNQVKEVLIHVDPLIET